MSTRYYPLMLLAFLVTSCAHHKITPPSIGSPPQGIKQTQTRTLARFDKVEIQGQINVDLHTGYKRPQVILSGDTRDLAALSVLVSKDTLHLVLAKGYPLHGPVKAEIRGQFLTRLSAQGTSLVTGSQLHASALDVYLANTGTVKLAGTIGLRVLDIKGRGVTQINGISSPYLKINLQGSPKVQLSGVANLARLVMQGSASLSLYWVKTDTLTVQARKDAKIQLAGAVNRLEVELWGNARFKGRYLRAQRSFVKTHGHSAAEISVAKHQSSFATDASDIYYYNLPNTRADFMNYGGSVLDMREWNQTEFEDFDRYNKQFP